MVQRASSAPALGLNTIIFKHVYWYMQQISGERSQDQSQDHWSSCFVMNCYTCYKFIFIRTYPIGNYAPASR